MGIRTLVRPQRLPMATSILMASAHAAPLLKYFKPHSCRTWSLHGQHLYSVHRDKTRIQKTSSYVPTSGRLQKYKITFRLLKKHYSLTQTVSSLRTGKLFIYFLHYLQCLAFGWAYIQYSKTFDNLLIIKELWISTLHCFDVV